MSKMEAATLIPLIVLFQFSLIVNADFEYICTDALLRKPYLKIYNTRLGDIMLDEGPGFYVVGHMKNIYVCTNGPVVLYFTRFTFTGDVYDEARNTLDIHKCQYYNGEPGPGAFKKADHLKAIMIFGNERDYRLPYIQTFTAPLLMNDGVYRNVTSVMTLGASHCEIYKEPDKMPIKFNFLNPDAELQMCRLPYQTIDEWVSNTSAVTANLTRETLTTVDGVIKGECTKDDRTTKWLDSFYFRNDIMTDLINTNVTTISNDAGKPTDRATDIGTKKGEINTAKTTISTSSILVDVQQAKTDLSAYEVELVVLEAEQLAYDILKALENVKTSNPYDDAKTLVDGLKVNIAQLDTYKEQAKKLKEEYENLGDPSNTVEIDRLTQAKTALINLIDPLQGIVDTDFNAAIEKISTADESLLKVQVQLELYPLAYKEWKKIAATPTIKHSSETIDKLRIRSQRMPQTIPIADYLAEDSCTPFPSVGSTYYRVTDDIFKGTCYSEKGTKLLGCQLLKARLGEPGICALKEEEADNDVDPSIPVPDALPATAYLQQYMVDVLNLINEIYKKACDRIRPVFAERVNNLLQCYLIKDRVAKGLTAADVNGTTPNRLDFWGKIITALKECRDAGHAMKFVRESQKVDKYYLKKNDDYIAIPFLKEQAENEYGFNFAIDMSWKVFATVLGLCMPSYDSKIPHINARFFSMYTEEFLQPIEEIWMSEKDNNIYRKIMSYYYGVGGFETWATYCMEASFLYSSDVSYRPPRKLLVNGKSESNYFVKGKKRK